MSRLLLIGGDGGKRRFYFEQAAACKGLSVDFLDWKVLLGTDERTGRRSGLEGQQNALSVGKELSAGEAMRQQDALPAGKDLRQCEIGRASCRERV